MDVQWLCGYRVEGFVPVLNWLLILEIQTRFYIDFPTRPKEQVYDFATPSTMKPTQWTWLSTGSIAPTHDLGFDLPPTVAATKNPTSKIVYDEYNHERYPPGDPCKRAFAYFVLTGGSRPRKHLFLQIFSDPGGGINQIPFDCTISGDVRLTPFYNVEDVIKKLNEYVEDLNTNIEKLPTRGPASKYTLPDENLRGSGKIFVGNQWENIREKSVGNLWQKLLVKNVGNQWENFREKSVGNNRGKFVAKIVGKKYNVGNPWEIVNVPWENQWENIYPRGFLHRNNSVGNPWIRALTHEISHGFYRGKNQFV
ncbi:acetylornithine deacetylase [Tanacetum coccineum]|uniref:Acetylornithine deacetylase n=1 Tax=Tanacetum coccineum TaxID=301880 RepID=A0ABQ5IDC6_9ASTR